MKRDVAPDVILANAHVLTMDRRRPYAEAVAVKGDRIYWVGADSDARQLKSARAKMIDCGGGALLPGFHDAHIHLLAYALSLSEVDCRPRSAISIRDIESRISERASRTPEGEWIRAWGYDETSLEDHRHPTRRDLDKATQLHPVRLDHRSRHASVLNSLALERVGIGEYFSEPRGATVGRELDTGEPSGILFEMQDYLEGRTSSYSRGEIESSLKLASRNLLEYGVTSVQDATHYNSVLRWDFFDDMRDSVYAMPRLTLMPGFRHLLDFVERGLTFDSGDLCQRVGHAKIMVTASSGNMEPSKSELSRMVSECVEAGFPVAIHAVEAEVVQNAAEVLSAVADSYGIAAPHRIEHSSECPSGTLELVERSLAMVVTHPNFVYQNGDRYLNTVEEEMLPYLYRVRAYAERGVEVAFGSDAPIGEPDPIPGIFSAINRNTESGDTLAVNEGIGVRDALEMYTAGPARASGIQGEIGRIMPGMVADMVLLEPDILSIATERLLDLRATMTILGGRIVSESNRR